MKHGPDVRQNAPVAAHSGPTGASAGVGGPEVPSAFNYAILDVETRQWLQERAERIHNLARMTAAAIVQIGQYLTEAKQRLGHGKFLEWIEREFAWTVRSAQAFMNVHEQFKNENFSHLEIDISALYLIAKPHTPEPIRQEAIRRAEIGEKVTHATVRAVIAEYNQNGDVPAAVDKLFDAVREARAAEKAAEKDLPSPAEARRLAIASGAHTLDRNGVYQPPMTHDQQAEWRADMTRLAPLWEFLRWINNIPLDEVIRIIETRGWKKDYGPCSRLAAAWLADFDRAIWHRDENN